MIPPFVGHAVCDSPAWPNGLSNPVGEGYHPNVAGHRSGCLPVARGVLGQTTGTAPGARAAVPRRRTGDREGLQRYRNRYRPSLPRAHTYPARR